MLTGVGRFVGVDPGGIRFDFVGSSSVGKGARNLTPNDLAVIDRLASEEMGALGYEPMDR